MTAEVFNLIFGSLSALLGNTYLVVLLGLVLLAVLFFIAKVPIYFSFFLSVPAIYGIADSGLLGAPWGKGLAVVVLGLIFGFLALRIYTDATGIW